MILLEENLNSIQHTIPENVTLVAVSKTKPIDAIKKAYDLGLRTFGENKVQELVEKHSALPKDIDWHLIGHLQKNKVKYIAPFVKLIHGVDNFKTLVEIDKQAKKNNRIISCLLQIKIAQEDTKFGFSFEEANEIINSEEIKNLENTKIAGLMGMATYTSDTKQITQEFKKLKHFFDTTQLSILSMGMSGDYQLAIEEGSTMVRVGSAIFGSRF